MRDGLAETELLIQNSGHRIEYRQQTDDIGRCAWEKNESSILGITDKHCWTEAGALGIPDVRGIGEVGLDRVVNTCARSVQYERNHASDCAVTENRDSRINSSEVWSTVSNAELRSKSTKPVISPWSIAQTMSLWSTSTADSVE